MTVDKTAQLVAGDDELLELIGRKAENMYEVKRYCCSESVVVLLNRLFDGGMSDEVARSISSGLCGGMGDAGCTCGALSGGILALGLFLSPHRREGLRKKEFTRLTRELHDRFQQRFRSTCCRVLTKEVRHDRKKHRQNCKQLTLVGAVLTAELLIKNRPELVARADRQYLCRMDTRLVSGLRRLTGLASGR